MVTKLVRMAVRSPFFPHWIETLKTEQGDVRLYARLRGRILEVGAGDGSRKVMLTAAYPSISAYTATDNSTWDSEFAGIDRRIQRLGPIGEALFGFRKRQPLDAVCSATNLPFEAGTFDCHISFEVLEHIDDPERYFAEAARVVKSGGFIMCSVPFMYRIHGGEPDHRMDFFRYAPGFFHRVAERNSLDLVELYTNTGYGTSAASITNQFIIRRLVESSWLVKPLWAVIAVPIFLLANCVGYMIDLHKPDLRFATRFHVVFRKQ